MKQKIISILLCICLLLGMMSGVFATDAGESNESDVCAVCNATPCTCEQAAETLCQTCQSTPCTCTAEPLSVYEQLLAASSVEEMFEIMNAEENYAEVMSLTAEEIDSLCTLAEALPCDSGDESWREEVLYTLESLSEEKDIQIMSSGNTVGTAEIFYANTTTAGYFGSPNASSHEYNASSDSIKFTTSGGDTYETFSVPTDSDVYSSTYSDYRYILVTFKATTGSKMQLFLASDTSGGYAEQRSVAMSYSGSDAYQTLIFDTHKVSDSSVLNGNIRSFRFDYRNESSAGTLELDSIAFCKTLDDAEYIEWERKTVRNNPGQFISASEMINMVSSTHNCSVEYVDLQEGDQTIGCLKITMNKTDCACMNNHDLKWHVSGTPDSFDPQFVLTIPGSISAEYDYLVLNFMAPDLDVVGVCGDGTKDDHFDMPAETIPIRIGTFYEVNGGYTAKFERNTLIDAPGVFYSEIINIDDDLQNDAATIRFDPFAVHFAKAGSVLYLQAVMFCKTEEEAERVGEEQLGTVYPYGYNLSFDANASDVNGMPASESIMRSAYETHNFTVSYSVPTRDNYKFEGWCLESDGSGKVYQPGEVLTIDGRRGETVSHTLYAIWQEGTNQIRYRSDIAGAKLDTNEELPVAKIYSNAATFTLPGAEATGYTFLGWKLYLGSGPNWVQDTYNKGTVMPVGTSGDVELVAQFSANEYTAKFDTDGGQSIGDLTFTIEDKLTLPVPVKFGYDFKGWKITSAEGCWVADDTQYASGAEFENVYGDVTFTANWTVNTYTVKFDPNNGDASTESTYTIEKAFSLPSVSRNGYTFDKWLVSETSAEGNWSNGEEYTNGSGKYGDVTLQAQWTENTVTINYAVSGVGGTVNPASEEVLAATGPVAGSVATPAPGYELQGWYTSASCLDSELVSTHENFVPSRTDGVFEDNVTYYAKFKLSYVDLTIETTGFEANQPLILTLSGTPLDTVNFGDKISVQVTVPANGSIVVQRLPVGSYSVNLETDWNWRYNNVSTTAQEFTGLTGTITLNASTIKCGIWFNDYDQ